MCLCVVGVDVEGEGGIEEKKNHREFMDMDNSAVMAGRGWK